MVVSSARLKDSLDAFCLEKEKPDCQVVSLAKHSRLGVMKELVRSWDVRSL